MTEETLFELAVAMPPADRAALLDRECHGDGALRARVERLLAAHDAATAVVDRPPEAPSLSAIAGVPASAADASTQMHVPTGDRVDQVIGPYRLLQKLGEGGMGTVWAAEQLRPVKRRVALKLIKRGMDSQRIVARFEAERQALALMDHTSIAKVFDAGTTPDGRPYFAMELVKGVSITKYCDEVHASIEDRLALFAEVCSAVQHAHNKGIIHRDLKPSNILVAMQDGRPAPKIIDFGVAKALHQKLSDGTMFTEIGQVIGTLEYMAPEQAELSALDIDTRADVYALGVLLYELLAGSTPITRDRLRAAGLAEVVRIIREEEPPRPSTRLSQSRESLANLAAVRRTDPRKLAAALAGELDWIVLKALEKDRTRRYETANAFKRDIERFLAHDPVEARPASAAYRFRKFYRRNRVLATAGGLVAVSLVAAIVGTTWGLVRARNAESLAEDRFEDAEAARHEAVAERDRAEKSADAERLARTNAEQEQKYAEAISSFVSDDFLALTSIDGQERFAPDEAISLGKDATLRQLLDRAAEKLEKRTDLEPRTDAQLHWIVGTSYRGLGDYERAVHHLEKCVKLSGDAVGATHKSTLFFAHSLGVTYQYAGDYARAVALLERIRDAEATRMEAQDPRHLGTLVVLAHAYIEAGRPQDAVDLLEPVAEPLDAKTKSDREEDLFIHHTLALAYRMVGRRDEALSRLEKLLPRMKERFGAAHQATLVTMHELAQTLREVGRPAEAAPYIEEILRVQTARLGSDHPLSLIAGQNLAETLLDAGRLDDATSLMERLRETMIEQLGPEHPNSLKMTGNLAAFYWRAKRFDKSIPLAEFAAAKQEIVLGRNHPETLRYTANLGVQLRDAGRTDEAIVKLERVVHSGVRHSMLDWVPAELLRAYADARRPREAVDLAKQVVAQLREESPTADVRFVGRLVRIGDQLLKAGAFADAERLLREGLAIREKRLSDEAGQGGERVRPWHVASAKSLLAAALLGQAESAEPRDRRRLLDEAESLLIAGWQGLQAAAELAATDVAHPNALPADAGFNLTDTLDRLVALYTTLDKPSEVEKWRAERAKLAPPRDDSTTERATAPPATAPIAPEPSSDNASPAATP